MMWPFREVRAGAVTQDATEVAISALAARAAGKDARPETLAALEIAASYVGRAFASAVVSGPEAARFLTREALAMIGPVLVALRITERAIGLEGFDPLFRAGLIGAHDLETVVLVFCQFPVLVFPSEYA